jgi:hypothetical protein
MRVAHQAINPGIAGIRRTEQGLGLGLDVGPEAIGHRQHGEQHAFRIAQPEPSHLLGRVGDLGADVEGDRNGPWRGVDQPRRAQHRRVVSLVEEAAQGRERTVDQQLEIGELARREAPRRPVARLGSQCGRPFGRDQQIDQSTALPIVWLTGARLPVGPVRL